MKYRIFLNQEKDKQDRHIGFFGYNRSHKLELAYSGELPDLVRPHSEILEELFYIFNVKHPADYRNRSLSVGDVVILNYAEGFAAMAYAVESIGFKSIPFPTGIKVAA